MRGADVVARLGATMALKWARVYGAEEIGDDDEEEKLVIQQKVVSKWRAFRRKTSTLLNLGDVENSAKATEEELQPLL